MKAIITYITEDGKKFENQFEAKKHECELTSHKWEYYNHNMGAQKEQNEETHVKFCKHCNKQEILN